MLSLLTTEKLQKLLCWIEQLNIKKGCDMKMIHFKNKQKHIPELRYIYIYIYICRFTPQNGSTFILNCLISYFALIKLVSTPTLMIAKAIEDLRAIIRNCIV